MLSYLMVILLKLLMLERSGYLSLILIEVLVVPCFTFNLILASKLTLRHDCFLIFLHQYCFVQDLLTWRTIGMSKLEDGQYAFQHPTQQLHDRSLLNCLHPISQPTAIPDTCFPVSSNSICNYDINL